MDASDLGDFLAAHGLAAPGAALRVTALAGGVSSDIARVDLPSGPICVKRALPVLKVAVRWTADVRRSNHEVDWLKAAARIVPGHVPDVIAADSATGTFAMPWFDPEHHPVWKSLLMAGQVETSTARDVGRIVGAVHASTADDPGFATRFAHDADFAALRLDPYLRATAAAQPTLRVPLLQLLERTARTRRVLVHGDVSPKNVLVGPAGPVLLDAECAWFGDPAFDSAFCLNHLLLKCLVRPGRVMAYREAFLAFVEGYSSHVQWEPWEALETRIASLLPALMLARVDGLSPVDYLQDSDGKRRVREFAMPRVAMPPRSLQELLAAWPAFVEGRTEAP